MKEPATFKAGDTLRIDRVISEDDLRLAVELTRDRGRWHTDPGFAVQAGFKGVFAPGLLTAALLTEYGGRIDYLARRMEFYFLSPVYPGDRITAEVKVLSFDVETNLLQVRFVVLNDEKRPVLRGSTEGYPGGLPSRSGKSGLASFEGDEAYRRASAHDRKGEEAEAIPCYEEALRLGLSKADRMGAMLGLGSSLRNVGRREESVTILQSAVEQYPDNVALKAFLGLSLHSAGRGSEAVRELLELAVDHSDLDGYEPALRRYADELK